MRRAESRDGLGAVEVLVVIALIAAVSLYLLLALPRGREAARRASCQKNLMQIGTAVGLYDQATGHLPTARVGGVSPFAAMMEALGQPDFSTLDDPKVAPARRLVGPPVARFVRGLACQSDPNATLALHPAPISYRASTGSTPDGSGGPFALGRVVSLAEVEEADGASYTAAFAERLVGGPSPGPGDPTAYMSVPGPIGVDGCPTSPTATWRGDAGDSWIATGSISTLYNHAALPDTAPACVATDGATARVGPSSGHPDAVHVLLLDGSLRSVRPSISPAVWRDLGTIGEPPR